MRSLLLATILLVAGVPVPCITSDAADDHKNPAGPARALDSDADLDAEVTKLKEASKARMKKLEDDFGPRFAGAKTVAERDKITREAQAALVDNQKIERDAIDGLMQHLRHSAATPAALRGILYAVWSGNVSVREEAGMLLHQHYLACPEVLQMAEHPQGLAAAEWIEPIIRDLLSKNTTPADHRTRLRYALATHLIGRAGLATWFASFPEQTASEYGAERMERLVSVDVQKLEAEALKLFEEVIADRPKDELAPGFSIAASARSAAYELRNLGIGMRAPEIIGEDLDGSPMRLSDYQGHVVILTFWANRCSSCLEFADHEQKLVERLAGRPFTPVGVNIDENREGAKRVAEERKFTWRSFWSGKKGWLADIPSTWNVHSIPTVYVIDHTGVIRAKNIRGPNLDPLIEQLVAKAEAAKK